MLTLLIVLVVLSLLFGGFGYRSGWGYAGWSPAGILIVVLLILLLTGRL